MKYVGKLTTDEVITLESARKNHPCAGVRPRASVVLLSNKGYQMQVIADICGMTRQTVSSVIDGWERSGLRGLYDNPRSGRPRALTPEDEEFIYKMVEEEPRSVNKIIAVLEDQRCRKVSKSTVKRVIRKKNRRKRIRKSLRGRRDEKKFSEAREEIADEEQRREDGEIDLYYFDEAGFFLTPCVPYAWQPKGGYIEVPSAGGKGINVAAFMNKDNECMPFIFECTINADVAVACFDRFCETVTKETVIYMDNSPVHKSDKFLSRIPEWEKKDMHVRFLPEYSPELNLIEILWRKIKYEWLPFSAYISFENLAECLEDILANFGFQYTIEFT